MESGIFNAVVDWRYDRHTPIFGGAVQLKSIAILDPFAGISGDMTLGALADLGEDPAWLRELPSRLGLADVTVRIEKVTRCSVDATKVEFEIPHSHSESDTKHHHGRTIGTIKELISHAPVSEPVKKRAMAAFDLLGEAEGRVHGVEPDAVHLHEVGAIDAVLDIVGAMEGFERLGVDGVFNLPVAVGNGWVQIAHGNMPIPAAATANLLEGVQVVSGPPVEGEATTPTGAAIIRVLSRGTPPDRWRLTRSSWGAGGRNPSGYPNALRLLLAETAHEAGVVEIVATDIDDMQPEYLEPLRQALLDRGALDCAVWPTHGKKGRVVFRVEALVTPDAADAVIKELFANSTSIGVRRWQAVRNTLGRREFKVELEGGYGVAIKAWEWEGGVRCKPEYDDVLRASAELGLPPWEVARLAQREAEARLRGAHDYIV